MSGDKTQVATGCAKESNYVKKKKKVAQPSSFEEAKRRLRISCCSYFTINRSAKCHLAATLLSNLPLVSKGSACAGQGGGGRCCVRASA